MIAALIEARRRRIELERRLAALRASIDRELGVLIQELQVLERLEREGERAMRELEPELHTELGT